MDSKQFESALIALDWSNKETSINLGIVEKAVYNYLSNKRRIPLYIEKFVLLHLKHKKLMNNVPIRKDKHLI